MTKILVTSIPVWSQGSGANTFSSLLELIKDENIEIANLYTRADLPDSVIADRYFQIIEGSVVKSVIKHNIKPGKEVFRIDKECQISSELKSERNRYSFFTNHRNAFFLWGREILWKLGKWHTKELDDFLDDFAPDVLFFPIESYIYFNRINEYIIKKCKCKKVVGYLWDDNFTYKQSSNVSFYISRYFTRKSVKRLVNRCDEVLSICPKMKRECDEYFGINSTILTKPIREESPKPYYLDMAKPIRMIYTGSLVIGRVNTLIAIASAIKIINKDKQRIYLDIYTKTSLTKEQEKLLNIPLCCQVKGGISQVQVFKEQENSDILLFVESFKNKAARLSFSTKITDYLCSGRCILAIGPNDISSMEYFKNEDAALVCNRLDDILLILEQIVDNPYKLEEYANKGYDCGLRNHNISMISNNLKSVLLSIN